MPHPSGAAPDRRTVRLDLSNNALATPATPVQDDSTVLRTPRSVHEEYRILRKIGGGGMGVVYLARDKRLGRHVAIKRLTPSEGDDSLEKRFMREARAIASLNHIHIVHVYSLGEDKDGPYIVMEYVPGPKPDPSGHTPNPPCSLADMVHRDGQLPLDAALDLVIKVCRAMVYAHGASVVHRDLKPANILVDESGEPKVVDFGLARVSESSDKPLTMPGEKMLSLGYGAPEQEMDASLADERADVYALGAVLYFCITGKNPRYFRPNDVPEVLRLTIEKALETDRDERWETVEGFMAALMLIKAPEESKLSTAKSTWRCKWCDTVNPILIRYCGECGWDGGTVCAECGSEQRFGIQFCGVCGADAKEYENAIALRNDLQQHMEEHDFPLVLQKENQIASFSPKGLNGRRLIEAIHDLGQQAGASLRRRSQLIHEIESEREKRNFETVRRRIEEYRSISVDDRFDDLLAQLDGLTLERDLTRLESAAKNRDWDYVKRNGDLLLASVGKESDQVAKLVTRARWSILGIKSLHVMGIALAILLVYLFSAAPIARIVGPIRMGRATMRIYYAPAAYFTDSTLLGGALRINEHIWGVKREQEASGI